ncbi:DsbA family protein [Pseudochryseolinea flava]|uniref:DsbA family protein n=1 Tax=Pseudochryseolinea flava TaxID=2059302 RepID=UPI001403611A|nr:DsbA family protein [Pseudochryseolinea flava]
MERVNVDKELQQNAVKNNISSEADRIVVNYYTDPLCCWSWAFNKPWQQIQERFAPFLDVNYIMCGMIPSWDKFEDPMNCISGPAQMGPLWMHIEQETKISVASEIWLTDPPSSSLPACLAVKCATLQSSQAGVGLFHRLQQALMQKGLNISKESVIHAVASEYAEQHPSLFNFGHFELHWKKGAAKSLLRGDIQQALYYKIDRYPTLTLTHPKAEGLMMVGYRPYEVLQQGFNSMFERI